MSQSSVQVESLGDEIRFHLPTRELGELRRFGWLLVALGVFGLLFMTCWISMPLYGGVQMLVDGQNFGWFLVLFATLGISALIPAIGLLMMGVLVVRDRTQCRVVLTPTRLYSNERVGPFWWRRKTEVEKIRRFRISSSWADEPKSSRGMEAIGKEFVALVVDGGGKPQLIVAPGYPHGVLEELAGELVAAMESDELALEVMPARPIDHEETGERKIAIVDETDEGYVRDTEPVRPADGRVITGERDGFATFEVPPAGLWRGSKGLFGFGIAWLLFMTVFTCFWVSFTLNAGPNQPPMPIFVYLLLGVFWAVGILMMVSAINMGRRSVLMGVIENQIFIERYSIFGKKWLEFSGHQIDRIAVGHSGMEVNDVPIQELQIHTTAGDKHGMLSQLDSGELQWLAWQLNRELGLKPPAKPQPGGGDDDFDLPDC